MGFIINKFIFLIIKYNCTIMNIDEVRDLFPYIKTGKIYFNHASTGPVSKRVLSAIDSFLLNASEGKIDDYPLILKTIEETKNELGSYLNCTAERIAFLDNTTNGINIIASAIEWKRGDRILLNDVEFPANVYPFLNLRKKGVEVDFVKSHNGVVTAEEMLEAVTDNTKLISISQVQFLSGYRVDLKIIGEFCRSRNIIFCVDAIQGLGATRLNVQEEKIDFISCGTQKWMLGLQGLAFIYVSEELQKRMSPVYAGWLSVKNAWNLLDFNPDPKESAELFQTGTVNTTGIFALNASLKLFKEFGYEQVEQCVLDNSEYLVDSLENMGIAPMFSEERKYLSGIVTFRHENASKILEEMEKLNIICAVREGLFRIAPHFYNTKEDIDKFTNELDRLIHEI
jgi:cysteine desulfurase / selenocysteine lyase